MSYLLDTCVVSRMRRLGVQENPGFENWINEKAEELLYVSVLTIGELQAGISKLPPGSRRRMEIEDWLHGSFIPRFQHRILLLDVTTGLLWGDLIGRGKANDFPPPLVDSLIAATARQNGMAVVTENTRDFLRLGVEIVNPLEEAVKS